jgi:KipI family sensor histidine kinase inhibitor
MHTNDTSFRVVAAGDTALTIEFTGPTDSLLNAKVLSLANRLADLKIDGLIEAVPGIRSLTAYYEPLAIAPELIEQKILELIPALEDDQAPGQRWLLPACYDSELAPDLQEIADRCELTSADIVELHCSSTYHVYMLGFLPGLAYMGDLPVKLKLPRRETPRARVPAGSVGIGGGMTCVYPKDTPCGWHLLARSPVRLWEHLREPAALLRPGDQVAFYPVSRREYQSLLGQPDGGALKGSPVKPRAGASA